MNRTPVLTLWAIVVTERRGIPPATVLALGHSVANTSSFGTGDDK
jgi:hypothetical protein